MKNVSIFSPVSLNTNSGISSSGIVAGTTNRKPINLSPNPNINILPGSVMEGTIGVNPFLPPMPDFGYNCTYQGQYGPVWSECYIIKCVDPWNGSSATLVWCKNYGITDIRWD